MPAKKKLIIIGGGASGSISLLCATASLPEQISVVIIDPEENLGVGRSYSTKEDFHVLNVPVERMSIIKNHPTDFMDWLNTQPETREFSKQGSYVPRKYFGSYIRSKVLSLDKSRYVHLKERVRSLKRAKGQWVATTERGSFIRADWVIVATGYGVGILNDDSVLNLADESVRDLVINGQDFEKMKKINSNDEVLIVGTGLSAVDAFLQISKTNRNSKISLLSHHGLLPLLHEHSNYLESLELPSLYGFSPLQVLQVFRSYQKTFPQSTIQLVQQIRGQAQHIWSCWSRREKKSFLTHLRPYWEITRHRLAPEPWAKVENSRRLKLTTIYSARVKSTRRSENDLLLEIQPRGSNETRTLRVQWVINAAETKIDQSIEKNSFNSGLQSDDFGFGYVSHGAPHLWLVGPSAKAALWETTAITDIVDSAFLSIAEIKEDLNSGYRGSSFHFHPNHVGETYFEHFQAATYYAFHILKVALRLLIHALLPFVFVNHANDQIRQLDQKITRRRRMYLPKNQLYAKNKKDFVKKVS